MLGLGDAKARMLIQSCYSGFHGAIVRATKQSVNTAIQVYKY